MESQEQPQPNECNNRRRRRRCAGSRSIPPSRQARAHALSLDALSPALPPAASSLPSGDAAPSGGAGAGACGGCRCGCRRPRGCRWRAASPP
eukprot:587964-Prorocentrum_minimum.AAC.1